MRRSLNPGYELLGNSGQISQIRTIIDDVGPSYSTVLLTGETGTGKEVVARQLHMRFQESGHGGAFVGVNCAALPSELAESELFGYKKGAFTGATSDKKGCIEDASDGTLFLDEVEELPHPVQPKLLRALDGTFSRLSETRERTTEARVIAATNQDLTANGFRRDLYYRLNVVEILVPPLRERPEDIGPIAEFFMKRLNEVYGAKRVLTPGCMDVLLRHTYPGNVRELGNMLEYAFVRARDGRVDMGHIAEKISRDNNVEAPGIIRNVGAALREARYFRLDSEMPFAWQDIPREVRKAALMEALRRGNGSVAYAAKLMDTSAPNVYNFIKSLNYRNVRDLCEREGITYKPRSAGLTLS